MPKPDVTPENQDLEKLGDEVLGRGAPETRGSFTFSGRQSPRQNLAGFFVFLCVPASPGLCRRKFITVGCGAGEL